MDTTHGAPGECLNPRIHQPSRLITPATRRIERDASQDLFCAANHACILDTSNVVFKAFVVACFGFDIRTSSPKDETEVGEAPEHPFNKTGMYSSYTVARHNFRSRQNIPHLRPPPLLAPPILAENVFSFSPLHPLHHFHRCRKLSFPFRQ